MKRLLDVAGALVGLALSWPLVILGALLVLREDGRPVLFVQPRVGKGGRVFPCYKLRTMRRGAGEGPCPAPPEDPRHLRCGRFLRRWAVDELPQLWNVLRGEMSLVGPRPAQPWEAAEWSEQDRRRLEVLPGLTGLAQVRGRNLLSWPERIGLDLEYVRTRSLALDLRILLATPAQLLDRKAAFGEEAGGPEPAKPAPAQPGTGTPPPGSKGSARRAPGGRAT